MRYEIRLTSITPLIFSDRMNDALYKGVDFDQDKTRREFSEFDANIVYQFACHEDRSLRLDEAFRYAENYYIPASSIKGALCLEERYRNLRFQDINVEKNMIRLSTLKKVQYLYQDEALKEKTPKAIIYDAYFPKIGIEMMMANQCVVGEIMSGGGGIIDCNELVGRIDAKTRDKLRAYLRQIEVIQSRDFFKELEKTKTDPNAGIFKLKEVKKKVHDLLERPEKQLAFAGGFKGLICSLNNCAFTEMKELRSGFYIDEETMLPYGLVDLTLNEK